MLKKNWHSTIGEQVFSVEALREQKDAFSDQFNLDFNELFRVYRRNAQLAPKKDTFVSRPLTKSFVLPDNRPKSKRGRMLDYANALAKRPAKDHTDSRPRS